MSLLPPMGLQCLCFDPDETGHSPTCEVSLALKRWASEEVIRRGEQAEREGER